MVRYRAVLHAVDSRTSPVNVPPMRSGPARERCGVGRRPAPGLLAGHRIVRRDESGDAHAPTLPIVADENYLGRLTTTILAG
jgi:hypothetical protein